MENTNDLSYSLDARATEYLFFCGINDVNIFVEDAEKEYEYETIFKRLLGEKYQVNKIFGVGGKVRLQECFREFGICDSDNVKNVYLADGDFDRYVCPDEMIDSPNFIYLETYNIENYFIDKKACESYVKGQLRCSDSKVEAKVDFENWKTIIVNQAGKLFFYYCFVKKEYPMEKSVSRPPYLFINQEDGFEKPGAFDCYKRQILSLDSSAETKVQLIQDLYHKTNTDDFNLICGKFLFESLYCHVRAITKHNFKKDDFRWHLICNFDTAELKYVRDRILAVMVA